MSTDKHKINVIGGPTASGKSSYALEQARANNGAIINADSMQLYNALPTLTAQPSAEDMTIVPHKMYAVLEPDSHFSAASWRKQVITEIENTLENDKTPYIVGGTGFYISVLLNGLSPIPAVPDEIRQTTIETQAMMGNPAFYEEFYKLDPNMAKKLHPNDTQRLIRAWEVLAATGQSLSYWQSLPPEKPEGDIYDYSVTLLMPEREKLYDRCNKRFDQMMEQNVMDEVTDLANKIETGVVKSDALITNALGFNPLYAYSKSYIALEDAIEQSKTETRQYAKRQVTWFKNQLSGTADNIITFL